MKLNKKGMGLCVPKTFQLALAYLTLPTAL